MADEPPPSEPDDLEELFGPEVLAELNRRYGAQIEQISNAFYLQYGKVLAGWAAIEAELCMLFEKITGMPSRVAFRIFYSARSFNGRADMFEAALAAADPAPGLRAFLIAAMKKIRSYSGFRNRIVHGDCVTTYLPDADPPWRMILTEGKDMFANMDAAVTITDLDNVDHSFRTMAWDLLMVRRGELDGPSLEKRRELILQRPSAPNSTQSGPNPPKRRKPSLSIM